MTHVVPAHATLPKATRSGEPTRPLSERVAAGTVYIWLGHAAFVFLWLQLSSAGAQQYADQMTLFRYFDAGGVLWSIRRSIQATAVLGLPLGIVGTMASRYAMQTTRNAGRVATFMLVNVAMAAPIPMAACAC